MSSYYAHTYTFTFKSDDGGVSSILLTLESDRQALNVGYSRLYLTKQAASVTVTDWKNQVLATIYKKGGLK